MDLINHRAWFQAHKTGGLSDFWLFLPCRVRTRVVAEYGVGGGVAGPSEEGVWVLHKASLCVP